MGRTRSARRHGSIPHPLPSLVHLGWHEARYVKIETFAGLIFRLHQRIRACGNVTSDLEAVSIHVTL